MERRKSQKKWFLKVVIIGDSGVGKTSLIQRYTTTRFLQEFKPTIGAEFSNKTVQINGQTVVAQIWDTAGQERYQSLGISFYRGADCCAIVFDKTDRNSFENLDTWRNSFLKHGAPKEDADFQFVIIGNKSDITDEVQVRATEVQEWWKEHGNCVYIETSAKDNISVEEAFTKLVEQGTTRQKSNKHELPSRLTQKKNAVTLNTSKSGSKKTNNGNKKWC